MNSLPETLENFDGNLTCMHQTYGTFDFNAQMQQQSQSNFPQTYAAPHQNLPEYRNHNSVFEVRTDQDRLGLS